VTQKGNIILDMQYMQNLLCLVALLDSVESDDLTVSDLNDLLQRAAVVGYPPQLSRESETHLTQTFAIFQCYRR